MSLGDEIRQYVVSLYQVVPISYYEGLILLFCIGSVLMLSFCGLKRGSHCSAGLLLVEYVFLLFCSTVIFRTVSEIRQYDFHPFWSYSQSDLLVENIMNVVVFIPIGLLLNLVFKQMTWWKALLIGCGVSITIETLQFFFMRGFSEVDDVMHNTMGCLIGFGIMTILRIIF